jgi:hypothetical protein
MMGSEEDRALKLHGLVELELGDRELIRFRREHIGVWPYLWLMTPM